MSRGFVSKRYDYIKKETTCLKMILYVSKRDIMSQNENVSK
nr:MAG TPA_asm: hypothetical protein [Caudoviricetes sp.]